MMRRLLLHSVLLAACLPSPAMALSSIHPPPPPSAKPPVPAAAPVFLAARQRGLPETGVVLQVDVATQSLEVHTAQGVLRRYRVSTASAGVGNRQNSNRTPLGWHRIEARIGGAEPPGRVFVGRVPQPRILRPHEWRNPDSGDVILTRILWLRGLEPGLNAGRGIDSHARYIYLHGTNQEHLLGQPASLGCIRLSNRDILELFDLIEDREAWCLIVLQAH